MLDIVNNLTKTAILGTALTVGGVSMYDEMTPNAATYFQEVQVAPYTTPESKKEEGFVQSPIEQEAPLVRGNSVTVDLVAKGPPKQDDYPRLSSQSDNNDSSSVNHNHTNFGLVKIN